MLGRSGCSEGLGAFRVSFEYRPLPETHIHVFKENIGTAYV